VENFVETRISTITLGVADLARSIRFYRDGLGFPAKVEAEASIAFFMNGGSRLVLYPLDLLAEYVGLGSKAAGGKFGGITLGHNVRGKEQVSEVLALAEAAGGKIVKPAQDEFWGGHGGYFTDPDGYYWEVVWAPMFNFDETGGLIF
jgi:uncharacterized protein